MNFSTIFFIQIIITILFLIYAVYKDVEFNSIPDRLTYSLIAFGLLSNLFLTLISANIKFILASIISMVITFTVTFLLWQLKMWGGGDVKLFTGIATVIPTGLNIDFLNVFPKLSVYPFSFSVVLNSILISFPFLAIFVMHYVIKNQVFKNNVDMIFNLANIQSLRSLIKSSMNKQIFIKDLREGNIINNTYFSDEKIVDLINQVDGNLKVYETKNDDEFKYYFKSLSGGGITKQDVNLLKIMNAQKFIPDEISIKVSYPYTPAILAGLIFAVFFGDMMMIFTKNFSLVIL